MDDRIERLHREMLYPVVRVRSNSGSGTGTILYSSPREDGKGHETYVLTNHHVVEANIKFADKWSTLLKKEVKTDIMSDVTVDVYEYEYAAWEGGESSYNAEIVAYDKDMDLALLRLKTSRKFDYVAKMFKAENYKDLTYFMDITAIGCGLGHMPIVTNGKISGFSDIIDNYPYWLSTAPTIFGNSGGAVYLDKTMEFLGVPSRIAVTLLGYSANAITHMSFFIPITSVCKFLEDQIFQFIYDPKMTPKECAELRKNKREASEKNAEEVKKEKPKDKDEDLGPMY